MEEGAAGAARQIEDFSEFGLSAAVRRSLDELGFEAPTPVQRATIRLLLAGRDVIAQAQTGTGKTAAYGIPMVERIDSARRRPQALVLAPTRELAVQVAEALHQLGKHRGVVVLPVYGGQPMDRQLRSLRMGVHVVVGTPGRLLDHLRRGTLDLGGVTLVVLDEADEMLDMGFLEDVEAILTAVDEHVRPERPERPERRPQRGRGRRGRGRRGRSRRGGRRRRDGSGRGAGGAAGDVLGDDAGAG